MRMAYTNFKWGGVNKEETNNQQWEEEQPQEGKQFIISLTGALLHLVELSRQTNRQEYRNTGVGGSSAGRQGYWDCGRHCNDACRHHHK